ncbi:MAG: peptide chain release factor N(5)-glutamine methyltransferase [Candidatus Palauibacterales bacterium]|nr:peptide chain release factor N(5)-glutamine methyltransferase [Candidatus Palauibacterales bacterium]MDP2530031.1 peptide chain release factor N(5)-glutamine methyltransferase [Candidatus Palauibacterales bacterium]MDP2582841.1 peptide chain release factor N(5)-glutamine methyltransferase [Candidatus Palauibacterales bacterium]
MGDDGSTGSGARGRGDRPGSPDADPWGADRPRRPPAPSRRDALRGLERELAAAGRAAGVEDVRLEAERLVAHVLGVSRAELARTGTETLGTGEARRLARAAQRRLAGEPLQHIEGTVQFRELVLASDPRALIPRPETEQLVDRIVAWARGRTSRGRPDDPDGVTSVRRRLAPGAPLLDSALDIGTGSGAIALSLVHEGVVRRAVGVDVDAAALDQAASNRASVGLDEARVELRLTGPRGWNAIGDGERFDLVVSNPPYVREEEIERLPVHVRAHEPRRALAGGPDGLDVVREIAAGAAAHLVSGGALFLEIGADQGAAVRALLGASGEWEEVVVERDLAGRERFVRARPAIREGAR